MLCDICERCEMLNDSTLVIPDGADEKGCPEEASIFVSAAQFQIVGGVALSGGFDCRQRALVGGGHRQEIQALPEHLVAVVSRQREKAIVGKNDWVVGCSSVHEHHRHPCPFGG